MTPPPTSADGICGVPHKVYGLQDTPPPTPLALSKLSGYVSESAIRERPWPAAGKVFFSFFLPTIVVHGLLLYKTYLRTAVASTSYST